MQSSKQPPLVAVVLAAGEGTRMRSALPKVLHEVAGRSLLRHVMASVRAAGCDNVAVVVGPDRDDVAREARQEAPDARIFVQAERRGTAHAVLAARDALAGGSDVLVLFGDTPLVTPQTIRALQDALEGEVAVAVLGFEAADPTGYGRLLVDSDGSLFAIREERDATDAERAITLCNGGIMALSGAHALALLDGIEDDNAKREYYLSDVVARAEAADLKVDYVTTEEAEILGINDRTQLATAEATLQRRLRATAMRHGATLVDPDSTFLSFDTMIAPDVVIEPHVVIGPGVRIATGAVIHAFSHLVGADVGEDVSVGPYARLRAGTVLRAGSRIGNFVETKAATIGEGAKVNHLSYVGDAAVGPKANIGAGTITCNYDGFSKHRTEIGAGSFVGSNSSLVAPVVIGEGAYIASGSVITDAVQADALAIGRGRQTEKAGWAARFRERHAPREEPE